MIDTGASHTTIAKDVFRKLGPMPLRAVRVAQQDAEIQTVPACHVDIIIDGKLYNSINVMTFGKKTVVGRDILNGWNMKLDGPNKVGEYSPTNCT